MHFVFRAMSINDIGGKTHKTELKSSHNYSIIISQNHPTNYVFMASGAYTHTHTHTHTHTQTYTHTCLHESDFKKPAAHRSGAALLKLQIKET